MSKTLSMTIPMTSLPSGEEVPRLGQGTWRMGEDSRLRTAEIKAIRYGFDHGLTLIDTAEMYADGESERIVAEAIEGHRDEVFLVSKVLPKNAGHKDTIAACERSLQRLKTDCLDLYLLHWRGDVPFFETVQAFSELLKSGKIRYWGVSNIDLSGMQEIIRIPGGEAMATNQILYNPMRRGSEWDLIPWCTERKIPIMAYSPIDEGAILDHSGLSTIAKKLHVTPAQVVLAWLLQKPHVISIPKAVQLAHIDENLKALRLKLDEETLAKLDEIFPPPHAPVPLEVN